MDIAGEDLDAEAARLTALRDALIKGILEKVKHTRLIGHPTKRLPNNINIGIDFVRGDSVSLALDVEGVAGGAEPDQRLFAIQVAADHRHLVLGQGMTPHVEHQDVGGR